MKERWERWDKKSLEKAKKISRIAARLFSRKGYLETTMDEIANGVGISKGGMYYYFPSKTDVLLFIVSNYMDEVLENLEEELNRIDGREEKLRFIVSRHIELYAKNQAEAKVLLHEAHCLPSKYFKLVAGKERKYYKIVSAVLPKLFKEPIPKGRLTALTFILFGMCNWIYSWYDPKGYVNPQKLSEMIYNIFLRGLRGYRW